MMDFRNNSRIARAMSAARATGESTKFEYVRAVSLRESCCARSAGSPEGLTACVFHSNFAYQLSNVALARFYTVLVELGQRRSLHWLTSRAASSS